MSFSETLGDLDNDNQIERESNHLAELASLRAQLEQANERIDWLQQQRQVESEQKEAALSDSDRFMRENSDLRAQLDTARQEIERVRFASFAKDQSITLLESDRDKALRVAEEAERLCHTLWMGLRLAHDAMVTWFSSEYAESPQALTVRAILDQYTALKAGREVQQRSPQEIARECDRITFAPKPTNAAAQKKEGGLAVVGLKAHAED